MENQNGITKGAQEQKWDMDLGPILLWNVLMHLVNQYSSIMTLMISFLFLFSLDWMAGKYQLGIGVFVFHYQRSDEL